MPKIKKKKVNKGGRPRDGKNLKIHKTLRLDHELIELIEKDFLSFSGGIEALILNYKSCKNDMKFSK